MILEWQVCFRFDNVNTNCNSYGLLVYQFHCRSDFIFTNFNAEVEPIPTFTEFGEREFMVAHDRGYEFVVHKFAEDFIKYSDSGHVVDERLKFKKVTRSCVD